MSDLELCKLRTASPASGTVELIRRCHWAHDLIEAQAARIAELEEMALQYLSDAGQWCDLTDERDALRDENERLRELIEDKEYLSLKARYLSGMLSFANWIQERERPAPPQQGDDA